MEVDVRLILLAILYAVIQAQDDSSRVDLTEKLLFHCTWCLRNLSSAACQVLSNGTISCIRCKEHLLDSLPCRTCSTGFESNQTSRPHVSCDSCLCNGSFDSRKSNSNCEYMEESCFVCQSNDSVWHCQDCQKSQGTNDCAKENDKVETKTNSGFSLKEKIIVAVCSTFGAVCLCIIGFLLYRHHRSRNTITLKKPFWTVELTNRNYDDLDFSLLDPITDVPLVYRNDIGDFDSEALLAAEKPHLVMEVEAGDD